MLIIPNLVISSWSLIWLLLGDKVPVVKGDEFSFEDSLWREHAFALICLTAISNIEWLQRRKWRKVKELINQAKLTWVRYDSCQICRQCDRLMEGKAWLTLQLFSISCWKSQRAQPSSCLSLKSFSIALKWRLKEEEWGWNHQLHWLTMNSIPMHKLTKRREVSLEVSSKSLLGD